MKPALPRLLSISPPDSGGASMWVAVCPALAEVPGVGLLLRVLVERERAVEPWLDELEGTGATVILHARTPAGARLAAERGLGLHLPSSADPALWRPRISGLLGASCHSRGQLERAAGVCDYATLSPVFAPRSKPHDARETIGLSGLAVACEGLGLAVFALGGLGPGRARMSVEAGAHGVAGIGRFGEPGELAAMAAEISSPARP